VATVIVVAAPAITNQPTSSSVCEGGTPTLLTVAYSNGTGTPTYQWFSNTTNSTAGGTAITGATNSSYSPPSTTVGTLFYYCQITFSSGGCTSILSNTAQVIINPLPTISTQPLNTQNICVGGTITALTVAYTGGVGTATYQWYSNTTNSNTSGTIIAGATNNSYTPPTFNTAGSYYYYATITLSGNGCGSTTSSTAEVIVVADPIVSIQPLTTQTLCQNSTPTDLTITVTGGIGTISYQWFSNTTNSNTGGTIIAGATNNSYTPPTATVGTRYYYCVVTQSGVGCNVTSNVATVIVVAAPAITNQPTSSSVCEGGTPTLLNITYTNGTGTPTYQWFSNTTNSTVGGTAITGATNSSYSPPSSIVGTLFYYCQITFSSGGCTSILSNTAQVIINQIPVLNNVTAIICSGEQYIFNSTNSADVLPAGIQYSWNLVSIAPAGTVTGSVNNGTLQNQFIQQLVNNSNGISTLVFNVTPIAGICTGNNFTITIEVYPKPDVQFDLANQTICNNTTTNLVTLSSSLPGAITFAWTANIPTGISGAIASGTGNIPIQTLVNSTIAPLTITYTAAATFTSNGNSCTGNDAFYTITVNPTFTASGVLSNYNGFNVSVFGNNDGTIDLTVIGGSSAYTFSWTGPNGFTTTTEDLTGLFAGTYTVTINDGYCAPIVLTFTLTQPPELLVQQDPALTINLLCFGDSNGAVGIQITQESVSPYDYTLLNSSNIVVQSVTNTTNLNPQFTGLIAGTYSVLVTDANGGTKTVTGLVVSQPNDIVITPTITEITCYGANNASISLAITGGTAPYIANWNTLATGFFQNNLAAGSYTITVTDANGCTKLITINIIEAPIFTINPVVTNISCFGANNGSINLNLIGGQAPVVVTWNDGSTSGTIRNNLLPGVYSVAISDGTPCYINRTFIIVEPQPLVLNATVQNALDCFNASSGAINLVVSGGTPPFTYVWSNAAITEDLSNIPNGNYSVVVTDSKGCIKTSSFIITRPLPLTLILDQDSQVNCTSGTLTNNFKANVSGGMPPFSINWTSGLVSGTNNEFMSTTQNGLITVTITDANGCNTSQSVTITNPIIGNAGFTQNSYAYTTFGLYSMLDPIQFTNTATGDYISVSWNFGDGTFSTEENPIHTYVLEGNYIVTQTVTYPLGCIKTTTISLIIEKGYVLVVPTAFTPNNDSLNDTFRPVTKGLKNVRLDIYDTWGSLIYSETGDVIAGWNGQIKNTPAENGNYYSKVSGETFYGIIVNENETFVLIK
jgi:gliding motility-associated-like protein